jgi:hypothetical protein
MSKTPAPKFKIGATVINWEQNLRGTVRSMEWFSERHDYSYTYQCEYSTEKLEG